MIEVKVNESKPQDEINYPCLMINSEGTILLLNGLCEKGWGIGTIINQGRSVWSVGHFAKNWNVEKMKPFNGTIELKNKD